MDAEPAAPAVARRLRPIAHLRPKVRAEGVGGRGERRGCGWGWGSRRSRGSAGRGQRGPPSLLLLRLLLLLPLSSFSPPPLSSPLLSSRVSSHFARAALRRPGGRGIPAPVPRGGRTGRTQPEPRRWRLGPGPSLAPQPRSLASGEGARGPGGPLLAAGGTAELQALEAAGPADAPARTRPVWGSAPSGFSLPAPWILPSHPPG